MTHPRDAIRQLFRAAWDRTGNQPPVPAIFPGMLAPVVRIDRDGTRSIETMRWGFPPLPNLGTRLVTNIRNTAYWRAWLKRQFRCLVPATSFCEYTDSQPKVAHWFALGPDRPPFAFAGIWRPWTGIRGRKAAPEAGEHLLFAFLTTEANALVRSVHAKAMPVILTEETWDDWLTTNTATALELQRPFPAERMVIIASGKRQDAPAAFKRQGAGEDLARESLSLQRSQRPTPIQQNRAWR